jgi:SAM-dependent methyltransferase
MTPRIPWHCPDHGVPLAVSAEEMSCPSGCRFPVVGGIPRFVAAEGYAAGFGAQWNAFRRTQLDSFTGATISRDRLRRCLGGAFDAVKGKDVLEAGCGAGRFTEVLLAEGARVLAVDLSSAVEANRANCGRHPAYAACQADILRLPVRPASFDVVVCLGVVQHTPDPEQTMKALCAQVKPGGMLAMDHYSGNYPTNRCRRALRAAMLRLPPRLALWLCGALVSALWPAHRLLWLYRHRPLVVRLRRFWLPRSPVVDYHGAYGQLDPELLHAWAMLDTHDTLTDRYKHLRRAEEVAACLRACGMSPVEAVYAGNGVEARAWKPAV